MNSYQSFKLAVEAFDRWRRMYDDFTTNDGRRYAYNEMAALQKRWGVVVGDLPGEDADALYEYERRVQHNDGFKPRNRYP